MATSPPIYGRGRIAQQLAKSRAPLTLVTGDRYVGKTAVLDSAAALISDRRVAPRMDLDRGEGAFRTKFLNALAVLAFQSRSESSSLKEFGHRVAVAASTATTALGLEVAGRLGVELLGLLPGGAIAGAVALKAAEATVSGFNETVSVRLEDANAGVIGESLAAFSEEVAEFVGKPLTLVFDDGDRLPDSDLRTLVDTVDRLRDDIGIWLGFATSDATSKIAADALLDDLQGNATSLETHVLEADEVDTWIQDSGLTQADLPQVMASSGGYPLLIGDIIAELRRGTQIDQLPTNRQFIERSKANFERLDEPAKTAVKLLVSLPARPDDQTLQEIVGLDSIRWGHLSDGLQEARIFTQSVDGRPWLHEQRRQYFESRLSESEARQSRKAVRLPLRNQFERHLQAFEIAEAETDLRLFAQVQPDSDDDRRTLDFLKGRLARSLGDYPSALALLPDPERDPRDWHEDEVEAAHNRAEILRLRGRYEAALSLWTRLDVYGSHNGDPIAEARAIWGRSLTYRSIGAVKESLDLCDPAENLRKQARRSPLKRHPADPNNRDGHMCRHKAELFCYLGDYQNAAIECARGFSLYAEEEGSPSWWELAAVESQLLRLEGKFLEALKRVTEAQDGFSQRNIGWKRGSVSILRQLAQSQMTQDHIAAEDTWSQLAEADTNLYPQAPIYAHLGLAESARIDGKRAVALDRYDEAERLTKALHLQAGPNLVKEFGFGREWAYVQIGRAICLAEGKKNEPAAQAAGEARSYADARDLPWLKFWSLYASAMSTTSVRVRANFVDQAEAISLNFKRRPQDMDLEASGVTQLRQNENLAEPTTGLLNLP